MAGIGSNNPGPDLGAAFYRVTLGAWQRTQEEDRKGAREDAICTIFYRDGTQFSLKVSSRGTEEERQKIKEAFARTVEELRVTSNEELFVNKVNEMAGKLFRNQFKYKQIKTKDLPKEILTSKSIEPYFPIQKRYVRVVDIGNEHVSLISSGSSQKNDEIANQLELIRKRTANPTNEQLGWENFLKECDDYNQSLLTQNVGSVFRTRRNPGPLPNEEQFFVQGIKVTLSDNTEVIYEITASQAEVAEAIQKYLSENTFRTGDLNDLKKYIASLSEKDPKLTLRTVPQTYLFIPPKGARVHRVRENYDNRFLNPAWLPQTHPNNGHAGAGAGAGAAAAGAGAGAGAGAAAAGASAGAAAAGAGAGAASNVVPSAGPGPATNVGRKDRIRNQTEWYTKFTSVMQKQVRVGNDIVTKRIKIIGTESQYIEFRDLVNKFFAMHGDVVKLEDLETYVARYTKHFFENQMLLDISLEEAIGKETYTRQSHRAYKFIKWQFADGRITTIKIEVSSDLSHKVDQLLKRPFSTLEELKNNLREIYKFDNQFFIGTNDIDIREIRVNTQFNPLP